MYLTGVLYDFEEIINNTNRSPQLSPGNPAGIQHMSAVHLNLSPPPPALAYILQKTKLKTEKQDCLRSAVQDQPREHRERTSLYAK